MAPLRIGLVGCGRWGRHVLRDLVGLGCAVSVVSRSEERRAAATAAGAISAHPALAALPPVDGIVVTTPTTTHAAVVAEALAAGVPVFVEKPLTDDVDAARALVEAAPDRLFVMHKWRYHPGIEELGRIARSGELGAIVGLTLDRVGWGNPHGDVDCVWMLVPHDISIVLEVLGAIPQPRSARVERVDGVVAGIAALLGDDPWVSLEASIAHPVRRREVRLVCSDGVAVLADPYADHLLIARGTLQDAVTLVEERRPISVELPLLRELRAFTEHLRGGPPPRSSAAEALIEVKAIAALRRLAGIEAQPPSASDAVAPADGGGDATLARSVRTGAPREAGASRATVVVPTHNNGATLAEAVGSALAQSIGGLDVLVIGDGPTPETRLVAAELAAEFACVRYIEYPKARGHGFASRHRAILEEVRSPSILYLADDDLWLPDHAETLLALLEQHPFAVGTCLFVDQAGPGEARLPLPADLADPESAELVERDIAPIRLCATAHTREAYLQLERGWQLDLPRAQSYPAFTLEFMHRFPGACATSFRPTAMHFSSKHRKTMSTLERAEEMRGWLRRATDPAGWGEILSAAVEEQARGAAAVRLSRHQMKAKAKLKAARRQPGPG